MHVIVIKIVTILSALNYQPTKKLACLAKMQVSNLRITKQVRLPQRLNQRKCFYKQTRVQAAVAADKSSDVLDITKMSPLGDRILLKPLEIEEQTSAGVLLPGSTGLSSMEDALFAEIIAMGQDVKLDLKAGDTVVFSKYGTADVEVADGKVVLAYEKSILATLS
eukprot:TRINITY_DN3557_c0_g1_i1.p2 TRINITY_DN3557_c0_g1~~TRINITY_DN3557_c0_g1_i1.p2  ORF type:complete len:165 (-),score=15.33 TRINITY_DN3557_c0_g1_i1:343-837(-)